MCVVRGGNHNPDERPTQWPLSIFIDESRFFMTARPFDCDGSIDDEADVGYEEYLTVEALLQLKFGDRLGTRIYKLLMRFGNRVAQQNGGAPGLLLTEDGGEFVSFHE